MSRITNVEDPKPLCFVCKQQHRAAYNPITPAPSLYTFFTEHFLNMVDGLIQEIENDSGNRIESHLVEILTILKTNEKIKHVTFLCDNDKIASDIFIGYIARIRSKKTNKIF